MNNTYTTSTNPKEKKLCDNNRMILKKFRIRGEKYINMLQKSWIEDKEKSDSEVSDTSNISFSCKMGSINSIEPEEILVQTDLEFSLLCLENGVPKVPIFCQKHHLYGRTFYNRRLLILKKENNDDGPDDDSSEE